MPRIKTFDELVARVQRSLNAMPLPLTEQRVREIIREEQEAQFARNREGLRIEARELWQRSGIKLAGTLYEDIYQEDLADTDSA